MKRKRRFSFRSTKLCIPCNQDVYGVVSFTPPPSWSLRFTKITTKQRPNFTPVSSARTSPAGLPPRHHKPWPGPSRRYGHRCSGWSMSGSAPGRRRRPARPLRCKSARRRSGAGIDEHHRKGAPFPHRTPGAIYRPSPG